MFVCLIGKHYNLTVRLLEARAGTASTILLWLTTTRITHKQSSVVVLESLLQLILGGFVNVLGVVGNNRLCNGGPNSVDLSCDTSTLYSDADIQIGELVLSKDQDWFEDLQTHNFGFNVLNGLAIDLDKTPTLLRKGNSGGCLLSAKNTNKQKRERETLGHCALDRCLDHASIMICQQSISWLRMIADCPLLPPSIASYGVKTSRSLHSPLGCKRINIGLFI